MAVMLRSAAESAVCRILSFPINKRNNIYKRVRQAVRLGQPASFFCLEYSSWRYTDDLNDAGECFTEKRLVLVVPYAFCVGVVLFCQISQPAPVPSPRRSIWLDRAVDVRQSLFYNSGKVLRLGVDVCHLRQGFPLPETETLRRPVPSCRR